MNWLHWLAARLSEPSTFAGIGVLAVAFGSAVPELAPTAHYLAVGAGAVAAAMAEKGAPAAV